MFVDEAVTQSAGIAAGKRPGHNRFGELRILQRGPVDGAAAGFAGEQERGAELGGDGAGGDNAIDVVGTHKAPRRHEGNAEAVLHLGEELGQRLVGRLCGRVECAAVATRGRALQDEGFSTPVHRRLRFLHGGHRGDGRDPGVVEATAPVGRRQAEREGHHLGSQVEHHIKLRRPFVVAIDGITQSDTVMLGLGSQRGRVTVDGGTGARTRLRDKQIDAERAGCQLARREDAVRKGVGGQVAARHEPETAGVGSGGSQFGRRRPARHGRDDHGNGQISYVKTVRHLRLPS